MSQCEPLLVSWSLSAWSLSPWPLSRRLARSASLNVELQQNRKRTKRKKKKEFNLPLNSCLIAIVSWLDTKLKKLNALVRAFLASALTFEQMAACCQHNWALRENFQSKNERKIIFYSDHVKILIDSPSNMRLRQEKKFPYPVFRFEFLYSSTWKICSRKSAEHLAVTKS